MSDNFKLKFDKLQSIAKTDDAKDNEPNNEIKSYESPSEVRNMCLVLSDGKRIFLNYAYLISGEYSPKDNTIVLTFSTYVVTLKGHALEGLFDALMAHMPRQIKGIEERYLETKEQKENIVTDIEIEKSTV